MISEEDWIVASEPLKKRIAELEADKETYRKALQTIVDEDHRSSTMKAMARVALQLVKEGVGR